MMVVESMTKREGKVHPLTAIPKAVPAAGGCSVFVMTMMKIANPTEKAGINIFKISLDWDESIKKEGWILEQSTPTRIPTMCPPIIPRGCAVEYLGIAKMMKVDAPKDAIIAALVKTFSK